MRTDLERPKRDSSSGRIAAVASEESPQSAEPGRPSSIVAAAAAGRSLTPKAIFLGSAVIVLVMTITGLLYRHGFFRSGLAEKGYQDLSISSLSTSGDVDLARLSPDGHYLAYVSNRRGQWSLWVRQISSPSAVQVVAPGTVIKDVALTTDGEEAVTKLGYKPSHKCAPSDSACPQLSLDTSPREDMLVSLSRTSLFARRMPSD